MQYIQDEIDKLEQDKKDKQDIIRSLVEDNNIKLDIEKEKIQKIKDVIAGQQLLLAEADALILSESTLKATNDDRKLVIDARLIEILKEHKDTSLITDQKDRKALRLKLTEENDKLEAEKNAIDIVDYSLTDQKVKDIEAKKLVIEQEQKDKEKESNDQVALVKKQADEYQKETERLISIDEKEIKDKEKAVEKKVKPLLNNIAQFNTDRTAYNAF